MRSAHVACQIKNEQKAKARQQQQRQQQAAAAENGTRAIAAAARVAFKQSRDAAAPQCCQLCQSRLGHKREKQEEVKKKALARK